MKNTYTVDLIGKPEIKTEIDLGLKELNKLNSPGLVSFKDNPEDYKSVIENIIQLLDSLLDSHPIVFLKDYFLFEGWNEMDKIGIIFDPDSTDNVFSYRDNTKLELDYLPQHVAANRFYEKLLWILEKRNEYRLSLPR